MSYWERMGPSTVLEATAIRWQPKLVREVRIQVAVSSVFGTPKALITNGFCVLSGIAELPTRCQALV